jgi:ATP-dependent Lon protease
VSDVQSSSLPLVPLHSGVVFPGMVLTMAIESPEAKAAVKAAGPDNLVLLVPKVDDRYSRIGTVARVEESGRMRGGGAAAVVRGLHRAIVGVGVVGGGDALFVNYEPVSDDEGDERATQLAVELRAVLEGILELRQLDAAGMLSNVSSPSELADTIGYWSDAPQSLKVEALETLDVTARLDSILAYARGVLGEMEIRDRIRNDVAEGMEKTQRDFLLRQQMAAIKKELGEDGSEDVDSLREKFAAMSLPEGVRIAVNRELDKLERTSEQSAEYGWVRNWLDLVADLPWGVQSLDALDLADARRVLDADHNGLADVKDRVLEFLAVRKLRAERDIDEIAARGSGAILTLAGPPGVGKTSLGESIARTLGRKFVRVALGGVRDEAEIRGHRRTYVGASAGRIVRALQEAGTMNPVMLLDEIDKVGSGWQGDPSSALLEVLDPAQNHSFKDHYLEVELDLSNVLFLATANVLDTIPQPLLDRMEVIAIDGYTEAEKIDIARDHLVERQLRNSGLREGEVTFTDAALGEIVAHYTREPGVRSLERQIGKVLRKKAREIAGGGDAGVSIDTDDVRTYLGRRRFTFEAAERTSVPGVASGLAVTGAGGDMLFIEAAIVKSGETSEDIRLQITGQLGDVMRESAEIALSYVRSHAEELGIDVSALSRGPVHLHVPAGAVPKDGPSAGVTMTTALASLLTNRPVKSTLAMTGEVTLRGKVLPIGGVKQKLLAAHRAGMKEVVIPAQNEADLDDVPASVLNDLLVHLATDVSEVLAHALEPAA